MNLIPLKIQQWKKKLYILKYWTLKKSKQVWQRKRQAPFKPTHPPKITNVPSNCGKGGHYSGRINFLEEFNNSRQLTHVCFPKMHLWTLYPNLSAAVWWEMQRRVGTKIQELVFNLQRILGNSSLARCLLTGCMRCMLKKRSALNMIILHKLTFS